MDKQAIKIILVTALVGTVLASSFPNIYKVVAADLTNASVSLTAQEINEFANTTIRFRTPTGVDAPTDTITIAWPAGFDVSSIVLTDIDLSHGAVSGYETDETLAAAPAAGTWGAAWSGQTLTFTAPTDAAAGEIGVNDYVVVEVGTHASFGGGGANQVQNPATSDSYGYQINGTFGDSKTAYVWIADNLDVGITATVTGAVENCTNGIDDDGDGLIDCDDPDCSADPACVPSGGGGDTTPPILSNIRCLDETPTSFTVAWDSNEPSTSCVEHGENTAYELGMECNSTLVVSHSIALSGLEPLTTYHYRAISRDQYFNTAISSDYTCATLGDTDAPVITNIRVINITATSVEIVWDTNEPATSQVDYGLTTAYGTETPIDMTYVTEHHVILTGLTPNSEYHFIVRSYDISGNGAVSGDNTFQTLESVEAPIISDVQIINITETSARVIWTTNEIADSYVEYGETLSYELGLTGDPAFVLDHGVDLTGLTPNTLYHLRVHSTDPESNESISADYTFTTLPDTTPPANVSDFTATPGETDITLTWVNPLDPDLAGVRICRSETAFPTDPETCTVIFDGSGTSYIDSDVVAGVTYYYTAFAYDTSGNFASGAVASARIPLPVMVDVIARPEKRWPRTGNWYTTLEFEMRQPGGSHTVVEARTFDTNDQGIATIELTGLVYGQPYEFAAKGFSHLRETIPSLALSETTATIDFTYDNTFFLLAGDIHPSKDNYVNSLDISTLLNDLMTTERVSDLNNDGQVNSLDITIVLANLSKYGDD